VSHNFFSARIENHKNIGKTLSDRLFKLRDDESAQARMVSFFEWLSSLTMGNLGPGSGPKAFFMI
jgi:hypothetical protein